MRADDAIKKMAEAHVRWWLESMRLPLTDFFAHGYKHGREDAYVQMGETEKARLARWQREYGGKR